MLKSVLALSLALFSFPALTYAIGGCGPDQVCTYKGRLKAGEPCPASFCQGSSFYEGIAAAAAGGVVRVPKRVTVSEEWKEPPKKAAEWKDPPQKAAAWKDPPKKTGAKGAASPLPVFSALEGQAARCRESKLSFAELSPECQRSLDAEVLGLANGPEKFCQNAFAGDEAGYARCVGQESAPELNLDRIIRRVLSSGPGSLEKRCRQNNGGDEEAVQLCLGRSSIVSGRGTAVKVAAPREARGDDAATSMSVE